MPEAVELQIGRDEDFKSTTFLLRRGGDNLLGVDAYLDRTEDNPVPFYAMFWKARVDLEGFLEAVNATHDACVAAGHEADGEDAPRAFKVGTAHHRGEGSGLTISSEATDVSTGQTLDDSTVVEPRRAGVVELAYPYSTNQLLDQGIVLENVLALRIATPFGDFEFDDTDHAREVHNTFAPIEQPMVGIVTDKPIIDEFAAFVQTTQPDLELDDVAPVFRQISDGM